MIIFAAFAATELSNFFALKYLAKVFYRRIFLMVFNVYYNLCIVSPYFTTELLENPVKFHENNFSYLNILLTAASMIICACALVLENSFS